MSIHGFELVKKKEIKELNSEALLYKHKKTGAELISMINDDENKVFGITFRTPPDDSTGLPHILEHSVLCGSRKYPVKEPFVELLKSSLQTFLNAMTYPDKTCYPVASQNLKDFYNLVDVYLDAVFYPRINNLIFEQEGWHYEINRAEDPLAVKGVVYSEMKGAYSSPDNLLARYSQQSLFPDNAYSLESGGDPKDIPALTYEKFYEFHKRLYHPSNSRIFFYGDDDPDERIRLMNDYLKEFDRISISSGIDLQKRFREPVRMELPFVAEAEDGKKPKGMMTVNWLLCETKDIKTNFALQVLSHILLGMPASPLRKALIESGLGEGLAGAGLETELREMYFSVGLKGMDVKDAARVEELIKNTLLEQSRGIDPLTIEAAINSIEFALRENNTGSYPRGLSIMLRSLTTWLYGADPFMLIAFEEPLRELKRQYKDDPSFFEKMVEKFFIRNTHQATVILKPDTKLGDIERAAEIETLDREKSLMSRDDIIHLMESAKTLKEAQESPDSEEALSLIPSLKLYEIDKENKIIPVLGGSDGTRIYYHDINTNGILYMDIGMGINALPQRFLPYVHIFGRALLEMGTDKEDYVSLSQRINRKTGGIGRGSFSSLIIGTDKPTAWLFLRGKAITHQVDDMIAIFKDMLFSVRLDNRERFRQIALEAKSALEQSIIPAGNRYVNLRIRSHYNASDRAEEQMSGISALFFLRDLVQRIENRWDEVLRDLEDMRRILFNKNNMILNATIDERNWNGCRGSLESLFKELPSLGAGAGQWPAVNPAEFEGLTIPSQVNYVGKGADLYKLGYEYDGSVNVITHFLRTSYLWERVRVQGGAYGAMCQFNRMSGVLTFVSYRDPNLKKTLDIYDGAADFLKNVNITESELHKSIIGAIGDIDTYMLPDARGFTSLAWVLNGNSDEIRQRMRDQVLGTSVSDFRTFADVLGSVKNNGIVKILGGQNAFGEAFPADGMPEMLKVL